MLSSGLFHGQTMSLAQIEALDKSLRTSVGPAAAAAKWATIGSFSETVGRFGTASRSEIDGMVDSITTITQKQGNDRIALLAGVSRRRIVGAGSKKSGGGADSATAQAAQRLLDLVVRATATGGTGDCIAGCVWPSVGVDMAPPFACNLRCRLALCTR
jgi:hypothetical protein